MSADLERLTESIYEQDAARRLKRYGIEMGWACVCGETHQFRWMSQLHIWRGERVR